MHMLYLRGLFNQTKTAENESKIPGKKREELPVEIDIVINCKKYFPALKNHVDPI